MGKRTWKISSSWTLQQNGSSNLCSDKLVPTTTAGLYGLQMFPSVSYWEEPGSLWFFCWFRMWLHGFTPQNKLKCTLLQPHCQNIKKENDVLGFTTTQTSVISTLPYVTCWNFGPWVPPAWSIRQLKVNHFCTVVEMYRSSQFVTALEPQNYDSQYYVIL